MVAKYPDAERGLPRSWEVRYLRGVPWTKTLGFRGALFHQYADPLVDMNFTFRKMYRKLKQDYGYLSGPIFFGVPFLLISFIRIRKYQRKLDEGKIRYRYRSPEHLRIPPEDLKQQPPWNSDFIAPLRRKEILSGWRLALEHGSRMCPREVDTERLVAWTKKIGIDSEQPRVEGTHEKNRETNQLSN